jgi:hypothetical protein
VTGTLLPPKQQAQKDFREGHGDQDSNPFDRATKPREWETYRWEMHRLWAEEHAAEIGYGKAEKVRDDDASSR